MILKNWKPISFPPIPDNLNNKLLMVSNVVLNQNELNLFYLSINWISEQIKKDNIEYDFLTRVTCIFTDTNEPTIVFDEDMAVKILGAEAVTIFVDMHEGDASATAWGCDLTYDYVKINGDYRT